MYEIFYSKRAFKDIELIKRNTKLYERYKEKERRILENPKCPEVPQGDFGELQGNRKGIYHLRLNQKHRIFYTVSEEENCIYINEIETTSEGNVKILQALGHDLK